MRGARNIMACLILAAALAGCAYDAGYPHRYADATGANDGFGSNDGFGYGAAFGSGYSDSGGYSGYHHFYGF